VVSETHARKRNSFPLGLKYQTDRLHRQRKTRHPNQRGKDDFCTAIYDQKTRSSFSGAETLMVLTHVCSLDRGRHRFGFACEGQEAAAIFFWSLPVWLTCSSFPEMWWAQPITSNQRRVRTQISHYACRPEYNMSKEQHVGECVDYHVQSTALH
jgi:hypothetical protein